MKWLLAAALLVLAGCAAAPPAPPTPAAIDEALARDDYAAALALVDGAAAAGRPELAARRTEVERRAARFVAARLTEARELADDRLPEAIALMEDTVRRWPQGREAQRFLAELLARRAERRRELETALLAHRARTLLERRDLLRALLAVDPGRWRWELPLRRTERRLAALADELTARGRAAFAEERLGEAEELLGLAAEAAPGGEARRLLAEIVERRRQRRSRTVERVRRLEEAERKVLLETELRRIRAALAAGELAAARQALAEARAAFPDAPELEKLAPVVAAGVRARVRRLMRHATDLYRAGDVEAAYLAWGEVLELDPDHARARELRARAGRVLENLRRLRDGAPGP